MAKNQATEMVLPCFRHCGCLLLTSEFKTLKYGEDIVSVPAIYQEQRVHPTEYFAFP